MNLQPLRKLLAFHQNAASSVQRTIELLTAGKPSRNGHGDPIGAAVQLDEDRRARWRAAKKHERARRGVGKRKRKIPAIIAQRQRTADLLDKYDAHDARPSDLAGRTIAVLVRRGYLKPKADGYVRTGKPFVVDQHASKRE